VDRGHEQNNGSKKNVKENDFIIKGMFSEGRIMETEFKAYV
jgi:hypothetical protein